MGLFLVNSLLASMVVCGKSAICYGHTRWSSVVLEWLVFIALPAVDRLGRSSYMKHATALLSNIVIVP